MNETPLINRAACKKYALEFCQRNRPKEKFNRVSSDFLHILNSRLRGEIGKLVMAHPSIGKTLKP